MSLIKMPGNDMRIVEDGELLITPEMIKEQMDSEDDLVTVEPFGARMVLKILNVNDDNVMIQRKDSGLLMDLKHTNKQLNNKINLGKVIKVGKWYNFYIDKWVDYSEMFNPGDIVIYEAVKHTPIIPDRYSLVPFDSVHGKLSSYEEMARLISAVQK